MTSATLKQPGYKNLDHGPRPVPLLGYLPAMRRDPLRVLADGLRRQGDVVRMAMGPYPFVVLNHPDHVRQFLVENHSNYIKSPAYNVLRMILGEGLLTSEGAVWRRQRRLAQPAFNHKALAGFADAMVRCTGDMLTRWEGQGIALGGAPFDFHEEMMRLTLRIVGHTLFSTEIEQEAEHIGPALLEVLHYVDERTLSLASLPLWVPTPANRRFLRARATLDRLVYAIIKERRNSDAAPRDLLGMLMAAADDASADRMTDQQLRDEVMTLVLAGHETTAVALSWTIDLLSRHPEAARRVQREVHEVLGDGVPTLESLERLTYTGWALQESMRLCPPAWIMDREALGDDVIGGHAIAKGTIVAVSPYTLHRNPRLWENPEGFDPERFSPERSRERSRYAYLPFGGGPRVCIGNHFAMMEAKIILAMVAQRHHLTLLPGHQPEPEPNITLRPKHGVLVTAHPAQRGGPCVLGN